MTVLEEPKVKRGWFDWLREANDNHPVWKILADCMKFLMIMIIMGGVSFMGSDSFDTGELRSTIISTAVSFVTLKLKG